jgi:hypothetical protein
MGGDPLAKESPLKKSFVQTERQRQKNIQVCVIA